MLSYRQKITTQIIIIYYNIMEENRDKLNNQIVEEQYSLLSFKLKKLRLPSSEKKLISSLAKKEIKVQNNFALLEEIFNQIVINSCQSYIFGSESNLFGQRSSQTYPLSTSPSSLKKLKRTKKSERLVKSQKGQTDGQVTYKFVKLARTESKRYQVIYEQNISSINDINGDGFIIVSDGRIMEGSWSEGTPKGCLKMKYPNRNIYYGPVYQYQYHGYGYLYFQNGERYEGEFCYGEFHGEGSYYGKDGILQKKGQWKRGKFIG